MELSLLGAAKEVGKSAVLLETDDSKIVLDYGVKVQNNQTPVPVNGFLDGVVLSHAHLDHSGAIPLLFETTEPDFFLPKGCRELFDLLIRDSIKIARQHGKDYYSMSELKRAERTARTVNYGKERVVSPDFSFKYFDAGHILGSAMTKVNIKGEHNLIYSGDYKDIDTRLHRKAEDPGEADFLVIESTYGDLEHPDRDELEKNFVEAVREVLEEGGNVVVPAFAVGRSQEILSVLFNAGLEYPVYLDGMGREVSEIYLEYPEAFRDYDEFYGSLKWANWIDHYSERETVFSEPSVVVTTAGMISGGPAMFYLPRLLDMDNSAVFFTGYQVEGTAGRKLLEEEIFVDDHSVLDFSDVRVDQFDFSGHTGKKGLHDLVRSVDPEVVFINHGDEEGALALRDWVRNETGIPAFAPDLRDKFDLEEFI